ncbi:MAG: tRNA pseudouridine(13) synthase TruD [Aquificae bacterium]|nr:tRNA pseudouridine(13) synthase TruD [Aquificota bacterium]
MVDTLEKRIKRKPSDFIVEEIPTVKPQEKGKYHLYQLKKSKLSTLQVIRFLSKLLNILPSEIGFAGLKDKMAITTQYITIPSTVQIGDNLCYINKGGKWVKVDKLNFNKDVGFCLKKVGYTDEPIAVGGLLGNSFRVKVYGIKKEDRERVYENLGRAERFGFPNYFGEQRFGSLKGRNDFIFKYLLKGDTERALKEYFSIKGSVKNWGKWDLFYRDFRGKVEQYERDLILGLKRGLSYDKAIRILPKNIRLMFNFAFQSYLWNRYLTLYIERKYPFKRVKFLQDTHISFYTDVDDIDYLSSLYIPFTGERYPTEDPILKDVMESVLKETGITNSSFNKEVAGIKVLTDDLRKAVVFPKGLKVVGKDRNSMVFSFTLPAGSYATILIRFLLA